MKKISIKMLLVSVLLLVCNSISFADAGEKVELVLDLPQDISETNFNSEVPYPATKNGVEMNFLGFPFLKENTTYIPVRDLADAFNIAVSYNANDRTVSLSTKNKLIIITPEQSLDKFGSMLIERENDKNKYFFDYQAYLAYNNRSYLPLRFVLETLDYTVDYDGVDKVIRISGNKAEPSAKETFFSDEQQLIIDSLAKFESERKLFLKGSVMFINEQRDVEAEITKYNKGMSIIESAKVVEKDDSYLAMKEMFISNTISYSLNRIKDFGEEEAINLIGMGSSHPYFHLTNTGLSGIEKYKLENIQNLGYDGKVQKFVIVDIDDNKSVELGIEPENKKLVYYNYKSLNGNVYNNFVVQ